MPVEAGTSFAGGLPLGFEVDRLNNMPIDASNPANEDPALRLLFVELGLFRVEGRPGGLPRRVVRCADEVPRLVLAYRRVLFFVLCFRS